MSLITAATMKSFFPQWEGFCSIDEFDQSADDMLDLAIETGEDEFSGYVTVEADDDDFTDYMKLQLKRIIRKHCFDYQHGAEEFEHKPQILIDYDTAIKVMEKYQSGELPNAGAPGANADTVTMTAKTRKFGTWFTDVADDLTSTEE